MARLDRPLDKSLCAVLFGLFTHEKTLHGNPLHTGHGDHGARDWIGPDREAADGIGHLAERLQSLQNRLADEHRTVGIEHHLFGIQIKAGFATRGQTERASLERLGMHQGNQFGDEGRSVARGVGRGRWGGMHERYDSSTVTPWAKRAVAAIRPQIARRAGHSNASGYYRAC